MITTYDLCNIYPYTADRILLRSNCVFFEIEKARSVETHKIYASYMFLKLRDEYGNHKKCVNPVSTK